jgi:multidrug efflux pump
MAFTIMGGLFVATFLTLLFLPALYALWFRKRLDEGGVPSRADDPRVTTLHAPERRPFPLAAE